jgi:hypothetical protein
MGRLLGYSLVVLPRERGILTDLCSTVEKRVSSRLGFKADGRKQRPKFVIARIVVIALHERTVFGAESWFDSKYLH